MIKRYTVPFSFIEQFCSREKIQKAILTLIRRDSHIEPDTIRFLMDSGRLSKDMTERLFKNHHVPFDSADKHSDKVPWDILALSRLPADFANKHFLKLPFWLPLKIREEDISKMSLLEIYDQFIGRLPIQWSAEGCARIETPRRDFLYENMVYRCQFWKDDPSQVWFMDRVSEIYGVDWFYHAWKFPEDYIISHWEEFSKVFTHLVRDPLSNQATTLNMDFLLKHRKTIGDDLIFKETPFTVDDLERFDSIPWNILSQNIWCHPDVYTKYYHKIDIPVLMDCVYSGSSPNTKALVKLSAERSPRELEKFLDRKDRNAYYGTRYLDIVIEHLDKLDLSKFDYLKWVKHSEAWALALLTRFKDQINEAEVLDHVHKHRTMSLDLAKYFNWHTIKEQTEKHTEARNVANYVIRRLKRGGDPLYA